MDKLQRSISPLLQDISMTILTGQASMTSLNQQ